MAALLLPMLAENNIECSQQKAEAICEMLKERIVFSPDLFENSKFFFHTPAIYDENVISKKWNATVVEVLEAYAERILTATEYTSMVAKELLNNILEEKGVKIGVVMQSLRVVVTGEGMGPDLMALLETLGKEEVANRIQIAIATLAEKVK